MRNLGLLIVDDEPATRNGLSNLINWKEIGIDIIGTAKDGLDAYTLIKVNRPHIIIVDINMPNCTGLELIEKTIADGLNIKFIILSGYDDFCYAQKAISLKVASYLLKPVKTDKLIEEVIKIKELLIQENKQTDVKYKALQGRKVMKEKFFNTIIDYELRNQKEIIDFYEDLELEIPITHLLLITFTYRYSDTLSISEFSKEDHRLFRFSVKNIINEFFSCYKIEFIERTSSEISLIIAEQNNDSKELIAKCLECINYIYNFSKINIVAGISKPIDHLRDLSIAYNSSLEVLSYRLYSPNQKVFTPINTIAENNVVLQTNTMDTTAIFDAIIRIDKVAIRKTTEDFLNTLFYVPTPPPKYIKGMCSYLIIDIQKKLVLYNYFPDSPLLHQEKIALADSFDEIKAYITHLFFEFSLALKENNLLVNDSIIDEVKSYLNEHLNQKVLLSDIAENIHLSESYLASYFKKKTGDNFRDYVIKTRMDMAKSALRSTNKSISEISLELGYSDYRSFNRVFKKFTNQTPTEYYCAYHRGKKDDK